MKRISPLLLTMISAFSILIGASQGAAATAIVKYVSSGVIYIDAGRPAGINPGDLGFVYRDGDTLARIEATFVSEKSTSCKVLELMVEIRVGDIVWLQVRERKGELATTPSEPEPAVTTPASGNLSGAPERKPDWEFKGRASAQLYYQDDLSEGNYDYVQPSANLQGEVVYASRISFKLRLRARRTGRSAGENVWDNRIYEASVSGVGGAIPVRWNIGRLTPGRIAGTGYLDGLSGDYSVNDAIVLGGFVGAEPDWGGGATNWDRRKAGVFALYEQGDWASRRFTSSAALIGSYNSRDVEREYLYLVNELQWTPRLGFYQSSEIEVNRGWREEANGAALSFSSLLLNCRWQATDRISFSAGYDDRKPQRGWEDRASPDSLFDDALRQGLRVGLSSKLQFGYRLSVDFSLNGAKGSKTGKSASLHIFHPNLMAAGFSAGVRAAYFESEFSRGFQPSISLAKNIPPGIDVGIQGGVNRYEYRWSRQSNAVVAWGRGSVNYWFGRRYYGGASLEAERGGGYDSNRFYFDFGVRM